MKSISFFVLTQAALLMAWQPLSWANEGEPEEAAESELQTLPLDELKTFTQVFVKIKNDYLGKSLQFVKRQGL